MAPKDSADRPRHIFVISCRSLGMKQGSEEDEGIGYLSGNKEDVYYIQYTSICGKKWETQMNAPRISITISLVESMKLKLPSWQISNMVFPKIGVPQNGWFTMENSIKMDDLGIPLFSETSICRWMKWSWITFLTELVQALPFVIYLQLLSIAPFLRLLSSVNHGLKNPVEVQKRYTPEN